jgi:hypothetical protein
LFTRTLQIPDGVDPETLCAKLAQALRDAHARDVVLWPDRVTFSGGMFRVVTNWNVLVPITRGELVVEDSGKRLRYRVSFLQLVSCLVVFTVLALVVMPLQGFSPGMLRFFPVLIWVWLGGGNFVIGILRFERFLRRAIAEAAGLTLV